MTPKPYSDKSALPTDSSNDAVSEIPAEVLPQTPSPGTLSAATTPSPTPQEQVPVENFVESVQDNNRMSDLSAVIPCYPAPGDIMPYDHSLPDFIRQITNQPNLANLQSLSLRVISTLISLHRMSAYLPNLRELDLEGSVLNSLRDIGCSLKNLQILKVGRCQLESLDGTFGLSSLRELYAQKNFINDVSPCSNLPHIRHIDVSGNRIRNISYAGFLSVCRKLKSIVFTGNPATEAYGYRNHVRRILPQVQTLDGIPFINEDFTEEVLEQELVGNDGEESNVPDFSMVSPDDSTSGSFKSEDLFHLDKKNKQAKNLANQDQSDAAESELLEASGEVKTLLELEDEFQISHQNQVRKGFLAEEQPNNMNDKIVNTKQKCTRMQKLDKDIENRSKKSNLLLNATLGEELTSSQGFSRCQFSQEDKAADKLVVSTSVITNDESKEFPSSEEEIVGSHTTVRTSNSSVQEKADEVKYGVIKKTPLSCTGKNTDAEQIIDQNLGVNTLTTGLPICGNLTAALRNRKKYQYASAETHFLHRNVGSCPEADEDRKLEVHVQGSADSAETEFGAGNEDDFIDEDILTSSTKWRQCFRRFRSNNRASWEEDEREDERGKFDFDDHTLCQAGYKTQ